VDSHQKTTFSRLYLFAIYLCAVPAAFVCFEGTNTYSVSWIFLTVASVLVATISIRLPTLSVVVSMGDVFTILALIHFGPGPALITYWSAIFAANITRVLRVYGFHFRGKVFLSRWAFNIACSTLSTATIYVVYQRTLALQIPDSIKLATSLFAIAVGFFLVNTATLSLALSLTTQKSFWSIWTEGATLYLLNFFGSSAAAGLISVFYLKAGFPIFLLCLPIAVVLYQLYAFYIQRYDQAQKHIAELNKLYLQTVDALAGAVDAKDRYTHGHIRRVQAYAVELAKHIGIEEPPELLAIEAGALLHDIGKIAIPEYILNKPTVLTETEFEKMKIHPVVGANMLKTIDFPYPVVPIVRYHHERWDGMGYPEGLKGSDIPLGARILSLVDCYDALTTNRPYRAPMGRAEVIAFFQRESGKAYDPDVVAKFLENLNLIEAAGKNVTVVHNDLWGISESGAPSSSLRKLERVQPTVTYGKALSGAAEIQRELYSVFEFTRAEMRCLTATDIFTFMGSKLSTLIEFDAAVFYAADLVDQSVTATHVIGEESQGLLGLRLGLEQKLSGWVAANNQSLCNLPPFPDFLNCTDPQPKFQMSAIAPINRAGKVLGAVSLYRKSNEKFSDESFRRLEIIAAQTALALSRRESDGDTSLLTDSSTGLANGFQLYLMFDQIAMDAARYEYPLAIFSIYLDDLDGFRERWGHMSGDELLRTAATYLSGTLRQSDLIVKYGSDHFVTLNPKMNREQAEALKSRLQNDLDHLRFAVRGDTHIVLPASIGVALFPEDGTDIEALLSVAEWRVGEDHALRTAVKRKVRQLTS
jgi:diguanylate cyclase (GGDEF)-like protein/putative nucleotidyltransferase with HDIG domain